MQMPSHIGNQQHCVNAVCYFGDKGINPLNQKGERLNDFFHLGDKINFRLLSHASTSVTQARDCLWFLGELIEYFKCMSKWITPKVLFLHSFETNCTSFAWFKSLTFAMIDLTHAFLMQLWTKIFLQLSWREGEGFAFPLLLSHCQLQKTKMFVCPVPSTFPSQFLPCRTSMQCTIHPTERDLPMWIIRSEDFHITHTHIYIYFQVVMIVAITFLRNVSGVSLIEIAIKGVPDVPHEDMLEFTKCHTCGEILGEYGESENDDNQWWWSGVSVWASSVPSVRTHSSVMNQDCAMNAMILMSRSYVQWRAGKEAKYEFGNEMHSPEIFCVQRMCLASETQWIKFEHSRVSNTMTPIEGALWTYYVVPYYLPFLVISLFLIVESNTQVVFHFFFFMQFWSSHHQSLAPTTTIDCALYVSLNTRSQ